MDENGAIEFFKEKKEWSKYKDLILRYYLVPYVAKVATLGKKVVVVDCCAGAGKFEDGELGSPLIIGEILSDYYQKGYDVEGYFIEMLPELHERLEGNLKSVTAPYTVKHDVFTNCIAEISEMSKDCTVFLYIDPFKPSCLLFDDMKNVYNSLKRGSSVETLINFMGTSFCRGIYGSQSKSILKGTLEPNQQLEEWNKIAGGDYWQSHILNHELGFEQKAQAIADGYTERLRDWFRWTICYAIKEKYEHKYSKYHLVFGSRHHDAISLMNDAMVKARREFVGVLSSGMLFNMTPEKEEISEAEIRNLVVESLKFYGKTRWEILRAICMTKKPCFYTTGEINRAIKKAIQEKAINSDCDGSKIFERAPLWVRN